MVVYSNVMGTVTRKRVVYLPLPSRIFQFHLEERSLVVWMLCKHTY